MYLQSQLKCPLGACQLTAHFMNLTPPFTNTRKENPGHNLTLGRYTHEVLTLAEIVDIMTDQGGDSIDLISLHI